MRQMQPIIEVLDTERFQPVLTVYPSGWRLDDVATYFDDVLDEFVAAHPATNIHIIAHSMGGLIVRKALGERARRGGENVVRIFTSIASPMGGHPSALAGVRFAPRSVPRGPTSSCPQRFYATSTETRSPKASATASSSPRRTRASPLRVSSATRPCARQAPPLASTPDTWRFWRGQRRWISSARRFTERVSTGSSTRHDGPRTRRYGYARNRRQREGVSEVGTNLRAQRNATTNRTSEGVVLRDDEYPDMTSVVQLESVIALFSGEQSSSQRHRRERSDESSLSVDGIAALDGARVVQMVQKERHW
ncbi:MAG: pimeloyl-ACP methyl ester carboxylesterase [Polyangiales bacterium]|jgi:pimeloyl-ACP methyl ester carboxylesterase